MQTTSIALACAALLALTASAQAQQPAATAAPEAAAPAKPKPKPRGPHPARALTIVNAGTSTIAKVEVTGESKTVTWSKPLAAKAKAVVKLAPQKACTVSVVATVQGEAAGAPGEVDICKEKQVRLTD
jgi:glucose/arabinose dehydrogenase